MSSSLRGWMLSLTMPLIVAGAARAQSAPKAEENKGQAVDRLVQDGATKLGRVLLDGDRDGNLDLYTATDRVGAFQQFVQWAGQPANSDVGAELTPVDVSLRAQLGLIEGRGLVVTNVAPDGRAAKAGLKANDILLTLAEEPLAKPEDLLQVLKSKVAGHPNEAVELTLLRGGKPASVKIKADVRVALAAAAEEKPDYYIGTPSNPLDETFRAHLDIPAGTGLIVGEIAEGTPAAKAGVKHGDILLAFGGEPLPDVDSLRAKIQAKGPHPAKLEVLRAGKPMTLTITPEPRKSETWEAALVSAAGLQNIHYDQALQGARILQDVPIMNRLFTVNPGQQALAQGYFVYDANTPPADVNKKLDELTAQVQALTKAVEDLRKQTAEKK